jgi:hypothetical protein
MSPVRLLTRTTGPFHRYTPLDEGSQSEVCHRGERQERSAEPKDYSTSTPSESSSASEAFGASMLPDLVPK